MTSSSSTTASHPELVALLAAQASRDPHQEAIALRALHRLDYKPSRTRGRSDLDRFTSRLVFGLSDCWIWMGGLTHLGYGVLGARICGERTAHRAAFRLFKGEIPDGLHVMHSCDVRCCVNPDHLSVGTHAENMRDMARKGRGRTPGLRGEQNPASRLTATQVREIRRLSAEGISQARLARLVGVSPMTISRIIREEAWR